MIRTPKLLGVVLACALFSAGIAYERSRLQSEIDEALSIAKAAQAMAAAWEKQAVAQDAVAKDWERRYSEVQPLVRQWRTNYETLARGARQ